MAEVSLKIEKNVSLLERFLGEELQVIANNSWSVNSSVRAEVFEVCMREDKQREDRGTLYLFPVDDNKFCLQLFFLRYEEVPSTTGITISSLTFLPSFFEQYPFEILMANQPFRFDQSTEQPFSICAQTGSLLFQLKSNIVATPFIKALQQSEVAIRLLRSVLECITIPFSACQVPACRFLAHEREREKIQEARIILDQNIDKQLTIRELSRKVAMNECYLKKGFKAITGKTIHEYQQELRITTAKRLLQEHGRTVTDVASTLGYSSISHFSAAFKRITGMKPCELLA